jgi:hypothetical protein
MAEILTIDRTWYCSICTEKSQPQVRNCSFGGHLHKGIFCTLSEPVKDEEKNVKKRYQEDFS